MPDLVPIEQMTLTSQLDGSQGRNRANPGGSQLSATDDYSAVLVWLARYADSPATLASYRKEAERLLLWCTLQQGIAMSDLTHEDLLLYQQFIRDPQPAERWVMTPGMKPSRSSPAWRPFAGPLSVASQKQALLILNAMFSWLVEAGYLAGNPLALVRRKRKQVVTVIHRFLPMEYWQEVKDTILAMPTLTGRDRLHAARCRWLFSLLYIGGLRISEVCTNTMGGFTHRRSPDGQVRWWLEITGKGDKTRLIPATTELMAELMRYREAMGLKPLPLEGEETPLVMAVIGNHDTMARSAVHEVVKSVFRETAARVRLRGADFEGTAAHIERASTHWLRHTAGTHLSGRTTDLKVVRDNLGHANLSTTNLYLHTEDDARHDATNAVHHVAWSGVHGRPGG